MRQIRLVFCCWRFFRDTITIILRFPKRTLFTNIKSDLALWHLENSHSRRWLSKWRIQTTKRETDLTYLHFEGKTLMELKFDNFLKIWQSKPRKLFFFDMIKLSLIFIYHMYIICKKVLYQKVGQEFTSNFRKFGEIW